MNHWCKYGILLLIVNLPTEGENKAIWCSVWETFLWACITWEVHQFDKISNFTFLSSLQFPNVQILKKKKKKKKTKKEKERIKMH